MKILVGADPEVFVRNTNHGFVCAHDMVPGTKAQPYKVKNGAVQVDGCALEFNIDPAASETEFITNIKTVYDELARMVPGYSLAPTPVAEFNALDFAKFPAVSKELGCDPDYNAWTGKANNPPQGDRPMRTAAGHIHIGWTEGADPFSHNHFLYAQEVCKQLDYYIGIQSLRWDPDNRRRSMYGRAGAFRPKPYGCEYRVPSNAWLLTDERIRFVYNSTVAAVTALADGSNLAARHGNMAQTIINGNELAWADYYKFEGIQPFKEAA